MTAADNSLIRWVVLKCKESIGIVFAEPNLKSDITFNDYIDCVDGLFCELCSIIISRSILVIWE